MADQQKKIVPINYTHREFETIRQDLLEIAQMYYPDTFQDFSEASFGSMVLDAVAYVGDQLSFYLDYNINEAFLDTAFQYNNVVRHGNILGYKYQGRPSTYGSVSLYILVPASATGIGPDGDYIPILKRGSRFTSTGGLNFVLTENVDFNDPINPAVVARVDDTTGAPTYYAIKATGKVVSGFFGRENIVIGPYERFKRVGLSATNISEIISVFDSSGNEYYEVDYLAQDIIYKELTNPNFKNDNVASVLKPYLVSRKFVVTRSGNDISLQFGSGKSGETNVVAEPGTVALDIFGKKYVSDTTFDPTRLSKNESFGIVPSNTTLTIIYRATNPINSNVATLGIDTVSSALLEFADESRISTSTLNVVKNSLEVTNEEPIVGAVSNPTSGEIKQRIFDTFPTQNRAVTQADYENVAYRLPAKFGSIKRCSVQKDADSLKRNLNMYVVSEDAQGLLTTTNSTIKDNLKTWLDQYRMINDTIDILDPYIINVGISFVIKSAHGVDKFTLLDRAISALADKYSTAFFMGEPLYISEIYQVLKDDPEILDVTKVMITNKSGTNYSSNIININKNLSPDGSYLMVPRNAILEIKYPSVDIKGKVV